jgi:hypothetical protein
MIFWTVIGSVAGVIGAAAAVVFGLVPMLAAHRRAGTAAHSGTVPADAGTVMPSAGQITNPARQAGALPGLDGGGDRLPARNPVFTGRAGELADLARKLTAGPVAVVAVRGLGGVGKSQLALEYAHRERQSGRYRVAGWVRADSPVTTSEDLAALGPLLNLPPGGTMGERAADVVRVLGTRADWLLVFDNCRRPGDLTGVATRRGRARADHQPRPSLERHRHPDRP